MTKREVNLNFEAYFNENILSVSELNGYVKQTLDAMPIFSSVRIRGEISNFKNHVKSGHLYFSLKDEESVIKAVMFSREARGLGFVPEDGMKVVATGRVSAYVRDGIYQIYVNEMIPDGRGELHAAYERLKKRLAEEGLFSEEYKKTLPAYPKRIGVITSNTGAAIRDIINITGRRWPIAEIVVYPALVQGEGAVASLINGVRYFSECSERPDVVIIGRGGGSIEDLWAFNSESLAREIAASPLPFISGVGHETDYTICDFVSSVRAPTPSGAAEIATPDIREIYSKITGYAEKYSSVIDGKLRMYREKLNLLEKKRVLTSPFGFIDEKRLLLDALSDKAEKSYRLILSKKSGEFSAICKKIEALSPLSVLSRGYGALYSESGSVITGVGNVKSGDVLRIRLSDGEITARAEKAERFLKKKGNLKNG